MERRRNSPEPRVTSLDLHFDLVTRQGKVGGVGLQWRIERQLMGHREKVGGEGGMIDEANIRFTRQGLGATW
jgi:hypothetical protein